MLTIIFRSVIIYIIVLFVFRIMGKRQIGQMQPFELVLTLIIADLATIPMAEVSVPVLHGIVPLLTLVIIHFLIALLSGVSQKISAFVSGKPVIIINPKGIDYKAMKKLNLSIDDIFSALRGCGYFSISQVQYAIMETNGKISVMPNAENAPVTNGDLNTNAQNSFLPIMLIADGKIMKENCQLAGMDRNKIFQVLKKHDCKKEDSVILLCVDQAGEGYLQIKGREGKTIKLKEMRQ